MQNPKQAMELTGGEYWTFFLQKRVGNKAAMELTNGVRPITASQALALGMVDDLMRYSPSSTFKEEVRLRIGISCGCSIIVREGRTKH